MRNLNKPDVPTLGSGRVLSTARAIRAHCSCRLWSRIKGRQMTAHHNVHGSAKVQSAMRSAHQNARHLSAKRAALLWTHQAAQQNVTIQNVLSYALRVSVRLDVPRVKPHVQSLSASSNALAHSRATMFARSPNASGIARLHRIAQHPSVS